MSAITSTDGATPAIPVGTTFRGVVLESPAETKIQETIGTPEEMAKFDSGLAFGPNTELRWQRLRSGVFRTVTIDDRVEGNLEPIDAEPARVLLWGDWNGDAWSEGRIPKPIDSYPARLRGHRAAVRIRHYRLRNENGTDTFLFRCVDFETYEEKP